MTLRLFSLVVGAFLAIGLSFEAHATVSAPKPSGSKVPKGNEQAFYQKALARIEMATRGNTKLDEKFYGSFNWVGRTALINYSCSTLNLKTCRGMLNRGLEDKAMVVRDHAFRLVLASNGFSRVEKENAAKRIIEDYRNYRSNVALWIVDRAQKFINASKS